MTLPTYPYSSDPFEELDDAAREVVGELQRRVRTLLTKADSKRPPYDPTTTLDIGPDCYVLRHKTPYLFEVVCHVHTCRYEVVYNSYLNKIEVDLIRTLVLPHLRAHMILDDLAEI